LLFQTTEFLVLFAAVFAGIAIIRGARPQHVLLTLASYVFYGWWDVRFLSLILLSTAIDYTVALGMGGVKLSPGRRAGISLAMIAGFAVFLLPDWPALQQPPPDAESARSLLESARLAFTGTWDGAFAAFAALSAFAVLGPLFYEALYKLSEAKRRKAFLLVSIVSNLGLLGFFKYFNFFADSVVKTANAAGLDWAAPAISVALPVGISFYTFQTLSYTIDAYRGKIQPERSFLRMALYVAYFPQLVAGPILRPQQFLPALDKPWRLEHANIISGANLVLVGLFKKVLIADNVAPLADVIFSFPEGQSSTVVMLGAALFAVQIYCDFSGYTDIARGISRVFGVEIPLNFNFPYFATSITDFWRRWHISLSSWLRDYLYIPLGGGRVPVGRVYFNLMATMVLGGLWHGASWNFVIWGFYQGALLCVNRLAAPVLDPTPIGRFINNTKPGVFIKWAVTLYFWLLGWLIFRVSDFGDLWYCMKKFVLFDGNLSPSALAGVGLGRGDPATAALAIGLFVVLHTTGYFRSLRDPNGRWPDTLDHAPWPARVAAIAVAVVMLFYGWPSAQQAFIYFQF